MAKKVSKTLKKAPAKKKTAKKTVAGKAQARKEADAKSLSKDKQEKTMDVNAMSAEQLMQLALKKAEHEKQLLQEEVLKNIEELKKQRQQINKEYRKKLREIDRKIEAEKNRLDKKGRGTRKSTTNLILELLEKNGVMTTAQIRKSLSEGKRKASNLSQTLAYLKRKGMIESVERSTYKLAKK